MPAPLTIIRRRQARRSRSRRGSRTRLGQALFAFGFVLSVLLVLAILAGAFAYANLTRNLPSVAELPILLNPQDGLLLQPTRLYDRSGVYLLDVIAPADAPRTFIPYAQLPTSLVDATLALADPDFWKHGGYELDGWRDPQTHPTLAQRLAAELLLWDEAPTPARGLRERLLAAQITDTFGRQQVIEWYLNSADYGHSAFGVEAAAQLYFGKPAAGLDLAEASLLAALSQAPALNPLDAPGAAEELRQKVLQEMLVQGTINYDEASQASANPPAIVVATPRPVDDHTAFANLVLEQLGQRFDAQRIRRGGLVIITTLDRDLQAQSACAIQNELSRLAGEPGTDPAADGSECQALPYLSASDPQGAAGQDASASALIIDPRSGQVLAALGDARPGQPGAYLQAHPAGTLLTPFIYLTGFTRGLGPASLGWDIPGGLADFNAQYRGPVRLRIALVNDLLPPAEAILRQMGGESVARIAAPFGLDLPAGTDILRDDIPVSPLEAAAAYGVFADQGTLAGQVLSGEAIRPSTVLSVTGGDGAVWADWSAPQVQAVVSPQLAYIMTDILSDAPARMLTLGDPNPLEMDRPAAAKLSRSFDLSAAWTVGYTPQRLAVVHLGAGQPSALPSAQLWHALMQVAVQDLPQETWTQPAGISRLQVCDPSGLLPTAACPHVVGELFLDGTEPIQADSLYQSFQIDRETGLLATVFTPPALVESHTYMVVPPEASAWAAAMSLPTPPAEYDAIQEPPYLPEVHITTPGLFEQVSGTLEVRGTAAGSDFASYRLEYGQGLNPQTWTLIGSDVTTPVTGDLLGTWDTTGLNGLYALRLLVVRTDRRVEQAVTVLTIGNP